MEISDLGRLDGPILLFGGVYSNFEALKQLWRDADAQNILAENRISTGDLVAYCADAHAATAFFQEKGTAGIAGNCEVQLANAAPDCGCGYDEGSQCSLLSYAWYAHAQREITKAQRLWMGALPKRIIFEASGLRFVVIHGGARDISAFRWSVTPDAVLKEEIETLRAEVGKFDGVIAGHSGIPFARQIGNIMWINSGALGMPAHDGDPRTHYVVLSDGAPNFRRLTYDWRRTYQNMIDAGLTQGYHKTLESGYWPSEDSLPEALKRPSFANVSLANG